MREWSPHKHRLSKILDESIIQVNFNSKVGSYSQEEGMHVPTKKLILSAQRANLFFGCSCKLYLANQYTMHVQNIYCSERFWDVSS